MNVSRKPRNRQFSGTRRSYSRSNCNKSIDNQDHLSPSPSPNLSRLTHKHEDGLVCVGCYNKKLSLQKHRKEQKNREDQQSKSQMAFSKADEDNTRNGQLAKNELHRMNDYNVSKIQENARRKQEEKRILVEKQSQEVNKQGGQFRNEQDHKRQLNQQRRNQLRQDLEKQITFAKDRRQRQMEEDKNGAVRPLIDSHLAQENRPANDDSYKQQLLQQINMNRIKKQQEEEWQREDNKKDNQLQFVRNADNKRQKAEQIQQTHKQTTKEQLRRRIQHQNSKREAELKQRQRETTARQQEQKDISVTARREEEERRNQIDKYLRDLKKQMKENQVKREEEFKWIQKETDNCIIAPRPVPPPQPCTSCTKSYPKRQLSSFITEKQT